MVHISTRSPTPHDVLSRPDAPVRLASLQLNIPTRQSSVGGTECWFGTAAIWSCDRDRGAVPKVYLKKSASRYSGANVDSILGAAVHERAHVACGVHHP